jgi:hypothetical protein
MPANAIRQISLTLYGNSVEGLSFTVGETVQWNLTLQDPGTRAPLDLTNANVILSLCDLDVSQLPIQPPLISRQADIVGAPTTGIAQAVFASGDTVPTPATALAPKLYGLDVYVTDVDGNRLQTMLFAFVALSPAASLPGTPITPLPAQEPLAQGPTGPIGPTGATGPQPPLSNATPQALGVAAAGTGTTASRDDHVHPTELPAQSGQAGKVLGTNGSAVSWVAGGGGSGLPWYNVMDYGATGDGTTDDGPAFQAAINAYETAGGSGTLYVPKPSVGYRIATPVITFAGAADNFLRVFGDGAVIIAAAAGEDCLNLGAYITIVDGLIFRGDGATQVQRALVVTGNTSVIRNCTISGVIASLAAIGVGGTSSLVQDINIAGSTCNLGILWIFSILATVENVTCQDGNINSSPCWIYLDTNSPYDVYRLIRNVSCDESNGSWIKVAPSGILGTARIACVDINGLRGIKNDVVPCLYVEKVDRLTVRNFTAEPAGLMYTVKLVDVSKSTLEHCDFLQIGNSAPASILQADSACGVLEIVESNFSSIDSAAAATTQVQNGQRTLFTPAATTALSAGLLLKPDSSNAGQYIPALHTDPTSVVAGVLIHGPAIASTTFMMPAVADFNSSLFPGYFYINDDGNVFPTVGLFAFSDPGHGFGGLTPVDLTGLTTAAQVAQAFANAINAATQAGFSVAATVDGTGNITIKCTVTGAAGDRSTTGATFPNNGQGALLAPNAGALTGGNQGNEIGFLAGQIYPVQIDGANAIAIGDKLKLSTLTDGRAAKATTGAYVGTAVSTSSATAGALVSVLWGGGTLP